MFVSFWLFPYSGVTTASHGLLINPGKKCMPFLPQQDQNRGVVIEVKHKDYTKRTLSGGWYQAEITLNPEKGDPRPKLTSAVGAKYKAQQAPLNL